MPSPAVGWGAKVAKAPLERLTFARRNVGPRDVEIAIRFCGVCHSDLHTVRGEWGNTTFPMIPGHEIVGNVRTVGAQVTKHKVGDRVGVGCLVNSCRHCPECKEGLENYCVNAVGTYNSKVDVDPPGVTFGGYSDHVVVDEDFVLRIPDNLDLCAAAPLLCAGITTYSPLRHWGVKKGTRVGVVGLGGLGHMAVKLANAMGAEVTVFTTTPSKEPACQQLGAKHVVISKDSAQMAAAERTLDVIIDTVGASHEMPPYLNALRVNGVHVLVGAPEHPHPGFGAFSLIGARRSLAGSAIGGIPETQEMLDFCGKHNIVSDVEKINIDYINEAYERMLKSDVRYRFVIDMESLKK